MQNVTIAEIAKRLNLSVATVSRAINPHTQHLVKSTTRRRVLDIAKSEEYTPNIAAKRLVTGKSRNIAVFFRPQVASLFFDDYYSKMIAGAMSALDKSPFNLSLSIMKEEKGGFDLARAIRSMDVAGAVVCAVYGVFSLNTRNIFDLGLPVLLLNQYKDGDNPGSFLVDNFKSAYNATVYLISRGHTRIGFVRGSAEIKDAQDRYMGYRRALSDNRIPHCPKLEYQSNFLEESGRKAVRHYFGRRSERPSAIFFSNDAMAMTAINELRTMGIACPEEVSIIGFDGIDAGRYTDPPLTTLSQPIFEMATEAIRQVIGDSESSTFFDGSRYFTASIIERGSVSSFRK